MLSCVVSAWISVESIHILMNMLLSFLFSLFLPFVFISPFIFVTFFLFFFCQNYEPSFLALVCLVDILLHFSAPKDDASDKTDGKIILVLCTS